MTTTNPTAANVTATKMTATDLSPSGIKTVTWRVRLRSAVVGATGHGRRFWFAWVVAALAGNVWFFSKYQLGLNDGISLPWGIYLVEKNSPFTKGDYVSFRWHGGGPYQAGRVFAKRVAGIAGDQVMLDGQQVTINGQPVGLVKTVSKKGEPLTPTRTGTIPPGLYYMASAHPDSLDSRYALTGWISRDAIIGRVVWKW
jgi:conjugal transfer pilin signal peptidase TrbI